MQKIFLDTDIGDDIDDALALGYALHHPGIEVIGISTVFRSCELRRKITQNFLKTFGRPDIPVAAGVSRPLIADTDINEIPCQWKDEYDGAGEDCKMHGVELMISKLKENPDAALVAVGPLTNVACAVRLAPELMENVPIYLMGGEIGKRYPEWNIRCDPEAARIVFSGCRNVTMVGLDVTAKCQLSEADVEAIANSDSAEMKLVTEMINSWIVGSKHWPYLHDPLTVAYVAEPHLLKTEPHRIKVMLGGDDRAMTLTCDDDENAYVAQVAVGVDPKTVVQNFMETLLS